MAKRIVCCPAREKGFEYLYVDTSKLLVKNISDELSGLVDNVKDKCCFDAITGYVMGEKRLDDASKLSFKFSEINSFELFKNVDELRFKTGSEKILYSCLLNYYRREYDASQQYAFFSDPSVSNTYVSTHGGVEHELTLENREFIKNKEEEFVPETLDKGKSDAEREAEAAQAQAEIAQVEAQAEAEAAALKKEKKDAKRKRHNRLMEEEHYRELRNQDDVQNSEYQRLRQYEEEMRQNNAELSSQYAEGNYNSLPGYVSYDNYTASYETAGTETLGVAINNNDLYRFASRMDEFGVPYTVLSDTFNDGSKVSVVYYPSSFAESGEQARDFFELEKALHFDNIVSGDVYYNAFQLSALDYAYSNNIDTSYVQNGEFNGNQMYRILDAGFNGYDMSVLSNPSYTPAHMDALTYYMSNGWDTTPIKNPELALSSVADSLLQEEIKHNVPYTNSFFENHDYNSFLEYKDNSSDYDVQAQKFIRQNAQRINEADSKASFNEFKENLHESYEIRQRETNYLPREDVTSLKGNDYVPSEKLNELNSFKQDELRDGPKGKTADSSKTPTPYTFGSSYTPTGYNRSDSSFVPLNFANRKTNANFGGSPAATGGKGNPQGSPKSNKGSANNKYPLNELKVRSDHARSVGLKVQNYGSRFVGLSTGFVRSSFRSMSHKLVQNDETGAEQSYNKFTRVTGNIIYSAQLITDLPRQFGRVGQGISYSANAIANVGRRFVGDTPVKKNFTPLSTKASAKEMNNLQKTHFESVKKQYGVKAAKMNLREVNSSLKKLQHEKSKLIETYGAANRKIKLEISELYKKNPGLKEKFSNETLINKNRKIKQTIKKLENKSVLTSKEKKKLADLKLQKSINEKNIAKNAGVLKKHKVDDKAFKSLKNKLKTKKDNELFISKKAKSVKELKNLKALKKGHNKKLGFAKAQHNRFAKKGRRWKGLPGRLGQSLVSQLNKAGDDVTIGGIASASNFAMSYARNPIRRIVHSFGKSFIYKPIKTVVTKTTNAVVIKPVKKAVKKTAAYQKHQTKKIKKAQRKIRKQNNRKASVRKITRKINSKAEKTFGKKSVNLFKKTAKGGMRGIAKVNKIVTAPFRFVNNLFGKLGQLFSAAKGFLIKVGFGAAAFLLVFVLLINMISAGANAISSFVFAGEETDDGRIDLTYYINMINDNQKDLQKKINDIATSKNSDGNKYDNVYYDYNGNSGNNTAQILAMAYVRFDFALDENKSDVKKYIKQLYADSNYVDYAESDKYFCDNGCEEREYHCHDKTDKYATETRKSLKAASDHYGESGVSKTDEDRYGCEYKTYSCTVKGHGVYNRHGCTYHNSGKAMSKACSCADCKKVTTMVENEDGTEEVVRYYCQGYCPGKHKDYYCDGHKEKVCYGEHQDITITITSLDFDEIFYADSSVAQVGSTVKGDAYKDKFTVTGYCACETCCGKTDGITASGVKAKANHTIAVDTDVIPLGTHVWIGGREYVAEDTGGAIDGNRIDIYFDSHSKALQWGTRKMTVYKAKPVESDEEAEKDEYGFTGWDAENIEIVKNVYAGLTDDDADEVYIGLDGISNLSYSEGTTDFDFSDIVFDDTSGLTKNQQKVLAVISSNTVATVSGRCQAWVAHVYQTALGGSYQSRCCANHAGEAWGASNDWSKIQVGATVYGYGSSIYGHVGIYIGDGKVAHNIGYLKVESLESWVKTYNGKCWGWNGGKNLTGDSKYNSKPAGTYMMGKD